MKSVVVITPSVGRDSLKQAIESVRDQSYRNVKHLVVADGPMYYRNVYDLVSEYSNLVQLTLCPTNTGKNGFYGHRIYAAYSHLVDQDYVVFLDEDNWFETHHIENLVNLCEEKQLDFAYSLRQVYIGDEFHAFDMCESIGKWPIWFTQENTDNDVPPQYLVDTSAYCFNRSWLINYCQLWHSGWGGDRRFYSSVRAYGKHETTGLHTLCYRLPDMQKAYGGDMTFFERGNEAVKKFYGGKYPWIKT
jgi:glycosyltransferase involved in cell wall biosynthesis